MLFGPRSSTGNPGYTQGSPDSIVVQKYISGQGFIMLVDTTFKWPSEGGPLPQISRIMNVSTPVADADSSRLFLPDANQGGPFQDVLFINNGPHPLNVYDNTKTGTPTVNFVDKQNIGTDMVFAFPQPAGIKTVTFHGPETVNTKSLTVFGVSTVSTSTVDFVTNGSGAYGSISLTNADPVTVPGINVPLAPAADYFSSPSMIINGNFVNGAVLNVNCTLTGGAPFESVVSYEQTLTTGGSRSFILLGDTRLQGGTINNLDIYYNGPAYIRFAGSLSQANNLQISGTFSELTTLQITGSDGAPTETITAQNISAAPNNIYTTQYQYTSLQPILGVKVTRGSVSGLYISGGIATSITPKFPLTFPKTFQLPVYLQISGSFVNANLALSVKIAGATEFTTINVTEEMLGLSAPYITAIQSITLIYGAIINLHINCNEPKQLTLRNTPPSSPAELKIRAASFSNATLTITGVNDLGQSVSQTFTNQASSDEEYQSIESAIVTSSNPKNSAFIKDLLITGLQEDSITLTGYVAPFAVPLAASGDFDTATLRITGIDQYGNTGTEIFTDKGTTEKQYTEITTAEVTAGSIDLLSIQGVPAISATLNGVTSPTGIQLKVTGTFSTPATTPPTEQAKIEISGLDGPNNPKSESLTATPYTTTNFYTQLDAVSAVAGTVTDLVISGKIDPIVTIPATTAQNVYYVYCTDRSTSDGVWYALPFGASITNDVVKNLAGFGLSALGTGGTTLSETLLVLPITNSFQILDINRAQALVYTGKSGNVIWTLPSATADNIGLFFYIVNPNPNASITIQPYTTPPEATTPKTDSINTLAPGTTVVLNGKGSYLISVYAETQWITLQSTYQVPSIVNAFPVQTVPPLTPVSTVTPIVGANTYVVTTANNATTLVCSNVNGGPGIPTIQLPSTINTKGFNFFVINNTPSGAPNGRLQIQAQTQTTTNGINMLNGISSNNDSNWLSLGPRLGCQVVSTGSNWVIIGQQSTCGDALPEMTLSNIGAPTTIQYNIANSAGYSVNNVGYYNVLSSDFGRTLIINGQTSNGNTTVIVLDQTSSGGSNNLWNGFYINVSFFAPSKGYPVIALVQANTSTINSVGLGTINKSNNTDYFFSNPLVLATTETKSYPFSTTVTLIYDGQGNWWANSTNIIISGD